MSRVAAIQMQSGDVIADNLSVAAREIRAAADAGAELILLPENFSFMGARESDRATIAEHDGDGSVQDFLAEQAQSSQIWLVGGSVPLVVDGDRKRVHASCLVYSPDGQRVARYDKIHLFDVAVPGSSETYRESDGIAPGSAPVVVDTAVGRLGLSVCYDLRFPELYRQLVADGAELLAVPSAFTHRTGEAHWEPLLRARAIENQCYVIAANQCGRHPGDRETWGHSMIVDPWGRIPAVASTGAGHVVAEVDRKALAYTRESFPCLQHRRIGD